ncbi:UNKNOWN [Stylonychia lemnae]|uniref:Uncharacterized protein n=1 Tax=Stylonychia lemnae TaxID=5949 RepID=A0A078B1J8_STYLE|nr:UNKNOWN [Stylonychia lemnae]|eukprot:CDW88181.1 UNKNOWN [Stylonychia lemnae]
MDKNNGNILQKRVQFASNKVNSQTFNRLASNVNDQKLISGHRALSTKQEIAYLDKLIEKDQGLLIVNPIIDQVIESVVVQAQIQHYVRENVSSFIIDWTLNQGLQFIFQNIRKDHNLQEALNVDDDINEPIQPEVDAHISKAKINQRIRQIISDAIAAQDSPKRPSLKPRSIFSQTPSSNQLMRQFTKQQSLLKIEVEDKIIEDARKSLIKRKLVKEKFEKAMVDNETLNQGKFKNLQSKISNDRYTFDINGNLVMTNKFNPEKLSSSEPNNSVTLVKASFNIKSQIQTEPKKLYENIKLSKKNQPNFGLPPLNNSQQSSQSHQSMAAFEKPRRAQNLLLSSNNKPKLSENDNELFNKYATSQQMQQSQGYTRIFSSSLSPPKDKFNLKAGVVYKSNINHEIIQGPVFSSRPRHLSKQKYKNLSTSIIPSNLRNGESQLASNNSFDFGSQNQSSIIKLNPITSVQIAQLNKINFTSDMKIQENNTSLMISNLAQSQIIDEPKTFLLETEELNYQDSKRSKVRFANDSNAKITIQISEKPENSLIQSQSEKALSQKDSSNQQKFSDYQKLKTKKTYKSLNQSKENTPIKKSLNNSSQNNESQIKPPISLDTSSLKTSMEAFTVINSIQNSTSKPPKPKKPKKEYNSKNLQTPL